MAALVLSFAGAGAGGDQGVAHVGGGLGARIDAAGRIHDGCDADFREQRAQRVRRKRAEGRHGKAAVTAPGGGEFFFRRRVAEIAASAAADGQLGAGRGQAVDDENAVRQTPAGGRQSGQKSGRAGADDEQGGIHGLIRFAATSKPEASA